MLETEIFKRILIPITGIEGEETVIDYIEEYKSENTIIYLVFIIDQTQINQLARMLNRDITEVKVEIEEKGWRSLYFLEEQFSEFKIRTNIQMLSGFPADVIRKMIMRFNINMLVLRKKSTKGIVGRAEEKLMEELIGHTQIPILII